MRGHSRKAIVQSFIFLLGGGVLVAVFQNCGKAGFDGGAGSTSFGSAQAAGSDALKSAPIPLEANVNQISFMSCPVAGQNTQDPDPLNNAYYTLRAGAYDNSTGFSSFSGGPVAGIGASKAAMTYLSGTTSNVSAGVVAGFIENSPYTYNHLLSLSVIARNRTPDFIAKMSLATTLLDVFAVDQSLDIANSIGNAQAATGVTPGTVVKQSFFSTLSASNRAMVGSLAFGQSESDIASFINDLSTSHYLFLGFSDASARTPASSLVQSLASPDGQVSKRLFGRGYALGFASRIDAANPPVLLGVREYDLNPTSSVSASPTDITQQENQSWDCFSLTIVRDIDRKYYVSGNTGDVIVNSKTYHPCASDPPDLTACALIPKNDFRNPAYGLVKEYVIPNATTLSTVETGENTINQLPLYIHTLCPQEPVTDFSTSTYADRLKVVRRFLPADQWEVNLSNLCAVPRKNRVSGYKCYASGDDDPSKYIKYAGACGPNSGNNECASFVSFCYRKN